MEEITMLHRVIYNLLNVRAKTQSVHWNYQGDNFISVHKYMDEVLEITDTYIDKIAEIMRTNKMSVGINTHYIVGDLESDILINELTLSIQEMVSECRTNSYLTEIKTVENNLDDLIEEFEKIQWFIDSTF